MKKIITVTMLALLLAGCYRTTDDTVSLEKETIIQTIDGNSKNEHKVEVDGNVFFLSTSYGIPNKEGWQFINPSIINLGISVNETEGYTVKVGSVYSDVSIVSKKLKYNGLRQDSMFLEYKELSSDGIKIDSKNPYSMPFIVEGVNHNETFLRIYNGYGYTANERATNKSLMEHAEGAKLNVVWTLYITNESTGDNYIGVVNDVVGLKLMNERLG